MKANRVIRLLSLALLLASLFGPLAAPQRVSAGSVGIVFTVNSAADYPDTNTADGICETVFAGICTLRAAIEQSNASSDPNTINFNIPGTGWHPIFVEDGALPTIVYPLYINGMTQPGCTQPCVVLNGEGLGTGSTADGLLLQTDNAGVRGLVITSFRRYGIIVQGQNNWIKGNIIGFWPGVATSMGNYGGIMVIGSGNVIGGTTAADRNVISGNGTSGIFLTIDSLASYGNTIQGNYIGTNVGGTAAVPNAAYGIAVDTGVTSTMIGGTTAAARNVISGNGASGVLVFGNGTVIQGNFIGTKASGSGAVGNLQAGIYIAGASNVTIGGATNAAGNRIANNGSGVIASDVSANASIRHNRIYHNAQLGIDLGEDGMTPNDALDADTGPNGLQNFPVITSATSGTLTIVGKLNSKDAIMPYVIEFFSSPAGTCDGTGYGEGAKFLGQKSVTTDATGLAKFKFVSVVPFAAGSVITATATDSSGNTSEFSSCRTAG